MTLIKGDRDRYSLGSLRSLDDLDGVLDNRFRYRSLIQKMLFISSLSSSWRVRIRGIASLAAGAVPVSFRGHRWLRKSLSQRSMKR